MNKKLPILKEGDPILREICTPVEKVTPELMDLAFDMIRTMTHSDGIGLAAPQIGRPIQLLVFDTFYTDKYEGTSGILFNPELMHGEGSICLKEQCLSIPGKKVEVERYAKVKIKYLNVQNQIVIREFKGITAVVVQHEMDHLAGIILSDHEEGKE